MDVKPGSLGPEEVGDDDGDRAGGGWEMREWESSREQGSFSSAPKKNKGLKYLAVYDGIYRDQGPNLEINPKLSWDLIDAASVSGQIE